MRIPILNSAFGDFWGVIFSYDYSCNISDLSIEMKIHIFFGLLVDQFFESPEAFGC